VTSAALTTSTPTVDTGGCPKPSPSLVQRHLVARVQQQRPELPVRAAVAARKVARDLLVAVRSRRQPTVVIHDVDESLRRLVVRDAVAGSGAELSFEAPTKEWAARRNAPTVNVYLYDVREDVERRDVKYEDVRDEDGRVVSRRQPPRRFELSYLVTVWTQRPEDEHRMLSSLLASLLSHDRLPKDVLAGLLAEEPHPILVRVAMPAAKDHSLADIWSALGGELKPSLSLVVTVPFDSGRVRAAGPPVLEPLGVRVIGPEPRATRDGEGNVGEPATP
jgi:Pvc16 N-terminal domain